MSNIAKQPPSRREVYALVVLMVIGVSIAAIVVQAGAAATRAVVRKGDIAPGSVTTKTLAKGAVTARKIRKQAITPPKLAKEAVRAENLASESVNARVLAKEAVGTAALAKSAVTEGQLAPGSVWAGALHSPTLVTKAIVDLDPVAHNGEWTPSNTEVASCNPGEKLLDSGFAFTNPGNGQVTWLQAVPFMNSETQGVTGRIATDSGGTAAAQIIASCWR